MHIIIDYTPAVLQKYGIGLYTKKLVNTLSKIDNKNQYTLLVFGGFQKFNFPTPPLPKLRGASLPQNFKIKIISLPYHLMEIIWFRLGIFLPVEIFTGGFGIFWSPNYLLPPTIAGKKIVTVHDFSFLVVPELVNKNLRKYLSKNVIKSIQKADLVLADSNAIKQNIINEMRILDEKVKVVYPGAPENYP